ncbi:GAF domain-containing protein [Mucilaginibacter ginsenosidivorax]|uniref:histidine kinase n=1 Tax=Mucilaginibacter ginsenosidivorax TaxID=862126 RepID=A0A5B8VXH6_9SPHI|nr:GAF domain-containing protein [Mucilaginibacter ginsenosidivorax]QEC75632.1 GAF domain-containing protein [Mucilaginibacter ginsenosidivorax]
MIDDEIRLKAVERFKSLDLETDEEFKVLLQMASETCDAPIALLTLLDRDTQWLKIRNGIDIAQMPREISFCTHTIQSDEVMVVPDATTDLRFADNPLVTGQPAIRFYAGAPLITSHGQRIGSLCVVHMQPFNLNKQQILMLQMLSKQAMNLMELRIAVEMLNKNKLEFEAQRKILRNAEISQRSFFESAPNFHILLNKNAEVVDFNKVAYNFIEKMHREHLVKGAMFIKFIAPDFVNRFIEGFKSALAGQNVFEEGTTDYGQHGIIYWEASFETARDAANEIIGISYIIRDVSDRKVKEIRIIDQNRSLLKIAHLQAHEFRAPLTTIMGMIELIKSEDFNAPREYYNLLETAVLRFDDKIREVISGIDELILSGREDVYTS